MWLVISTAFSKIKDLSRLQAVMYTLDVVISEHIIGTGQGAVMLCGWEGNRRPGGK